MGRSSRGVGLATTLSVVGLAVLLATAIAAVTLFHLRFGGRQEPSTMARELAESVLAEAVSKLVEPAPTFGRDPLKDVIRARCPQEPDSKAMLTFDRSQGNWSTFNLGSPDVKQGWNGRRVPPNSVHLVATARVRSDVVKAEAIVACPAFPFTFACQGTITSSGGLLVSAVDDPASLSAVLAGDPGLLQPGNMLSNSTSPRAISLGSGTTITGDVQVQNLGGVMLGSGSRVLGEIRKSDPVAIPTIDIASLDPETLGEGGIQSIPGGTLGPASWSGIVRSAAGLTINGDLSLNNSYVYINGPLEVKGGVIGTGAIIVRGTTTIRGSTALTADDVCALLSEGDIKLGQATGSESTFQGLVYPGGNLTADRMTLVGMFVSNAASMQLNNVRGVFSERYSRVSLKIPYTSAGSSPSPPGPTTSSGVGVTGDDDDIVFHSLQILQSPGGEPLYTFTAQRQDTWVLTGPIISGTNMTATEVAQIVVEATGGGTDTEVTPQHVVNWLRTASPFGSRTVPDPNPPPPVSGRAPILGTSSEITLDLDRFLSFEDKVRIILWTSRL